MDFTTSKAITTAVVALVTALVGIIVAAGLPLSHDLTDAIIQFFTVATPIALAVIGWLHHSTAQIKAAALKAQALTGLNKAALNLEASQRIQAIE